MTTTTPWIRTTRPDTLRPRWWVPGDFKASSSTETPPPLSDALEWHDGVVAARFHIQTNSAYVYEEVDTRGGQIWYEHGFVYVDGNEIDVNILGDGDGPVEETSFLTFTLQGDVFTLQESEDGTTTVFTLSRR